MMETTVAPVRKQIDISCTPEHAFATFTDGINDWWPLAVHSIGGTDATRAVIEARSGGRIYEVSSAGDESLWGTVLECDPPNRLVFSWHPGTDPSTPTEVEIRFEATDAGTRVELEHRNWDRLGARAASTRESYDSGWVGVLAAYERAVA
jgi:uncharacterized protein YndB with AHSA1/START domain